MIKTTVFPNLKERSCPRASNQILATLMDEHIIIYIPHISFLGLQFLLLSEIKCQLVKAPLAALSVHI